MNRGMGVVLAASVAMVIAVPAEAQPEAADARVVGIVVEDGRPAAGVAVRIEFDVDSTAGAVFGAFTLGFGCLIPDVCDTDPEEAGDTSTDDAGRYEGPLPNSYIAGTETDTHWFVNAGRRPTGSQLAGPTSSFEFEVNTAVQEAPPLPLWSVEPAVTVDGWRTTVTVGEPPAGLARPELTVANADTEARSRSRVVDGLSGTVDVRWLEPEIADRRGPIVAFFTSFADVRVPHAEGRTIYHQRVSTATAPVPLAVPIPPSRGASCVGVADPCVVTDGDRFFSIGDAGADGNAGGATSVTVELPIAIELADVFVDGCHLGCVVEASGDGRSWATMTNDAAASEPHAEFPDRPMLVSSFRPALPARFVRVSDSRPLEVVEVSAWPPSPPEPLPPAPPSDGPGGEPDDERAAPARRGDGGDGVDDDADTEWAALLAGAFALVVGATAVGVLIGRRTLSR